MHVKTREAPPTKEEETRPRESVRLQTGRIRVVALVVKATGDVLRRDCYDPEGSEGEGSMRVVDGELWLRVIEWARSRSMDAEVGVRWERTGFAPEEISRISVFAWPIRTPIRVFEEEDKRALLTPVHGLST